LIISNAIIKFLLLGNSIETSSPIIEIFLNRIWVEIKRFFEFKYLARTYGDGLALELVAGQFGQGPEGVLPPVHADEGAAPGRDQIDCKQQNKIGREIFFK